MLDVKLLIESVQDYIARALKPLASRLDGLESAIKAIPEPKNGKDGIDGKDGQNGKDGAPGVDGKDGADGKSVSIEDVMPSLQEAAQTYLKSLPVPAPGKDGKDGESVTVEQVLAGLNAHVDKAMAEYMLEFERRADDRIERKLAEIPKPKDGRDALEVEDFDLTLGDDGRTVTVSLKRGDVLVEKSLRIGNLVDQGVFKDGQEYQAGDGVTWAGSYFIAQKDAPVGKPGEPGSSGWRLAVKRGRDGKDGRNGIDMTATVKL